MSAWEVCLGEHPDALPEEVRVLIDYRLAQQLRESYPQFIGHRVVPSEETNLPNGECTVAVFVNSLGLLQNCADTTFRRRTSETR
jgi:hypothetical protein